MKRSVHSSFALLLCALVLAACTQPAINIAPTVTISSPTDGTTLWHGAAVTLSATAEDEQDGDLSGSVTWTSDRDGALDPDAGDVILSVGQHVVTASVTDAGGMSASDTVSVTVNAVLSTHVVAEGLDLHLVAIQDGAMAILATASIPVVAPNENLGIFNIIAHPTEPWLYTASLVQGSWGDARIDRFVVEGDDITYDGAAFVYAADLPGILCTSNDGNAPIVGDCAPIGMVFSPDAQTLYVDDDSLDGVQVFSVDAAGDLTFVAEGATTQAHGLTIDPTGAHLYNGTWVIDVTGAVPTVVTNGEGGNSTSIVDLGSGPGLITTTWTDDVAVYDLTDPEAPLQIDSFAVGVEQVRELAFTADLNRIVGVGRDTIAVLSFDGALLSEVDRYTSPATTEYRDVGLSADGAWVLASWFGGATEGGVDLFSLAEDGTITFVDGTVFGARSRALFTLPR